MANAWYLTGMNPAKNEKMSVAGAVVPPWANSIPQIRINAIVKSVLVNLND